MPCGAAQRDANKAIEDNERYSKEAQAYANDILPKARGAAQRQMQDAEGYKAQVVSLAEGDVARFNSVYSAYAQAPEVTRQRMYIETIEQIMQQSKKVILDAKTGSGGNMIYLPLDKMLERSTAPRTGTCRRRQPRQLKRSPASRSTAAAGECADASRSTSDCLRSARPWSFWAGVRCSRCSETEVAIRMRFGEIVGSGYGPGLHLKMPLGIDNIRRFERRIITQRYEGETFLTSENKALIVDFYVKWRVKDPSAYYRTTNGNSDIASQRLGDNVKDGIKGVVARRTLQEIVITERTAFTGDMFSRASESGNELGIELIDVRVQRIDLPDEVSGSVYQRMQDSFRARGNQLRAEGSADAETHPRRRRPSAHRDAGHCAARFAAAARRG